jgi:hypothetical protein
MLHNKNYLASALRIPALLKQILPGEALQELL